MDEFGNSHGKHEQEEAREIFKDISGGVGFYGKTHHQHKSNRKKWSHIMGDLKREKKDMLFGGPL